MAVPFGDGSPTPSQRSETPREIRFCASSTISDVIGGEVELRDTAIGPMNRFPARAGSVTVHATTTVLDIRLPVGDLGT